MPTVRILALALLVAGCASQPPSKLLSVPPPTDLLAAPPPAEGPTPEAPQSVSRGGTSGATAVQGLVGVTFYDDMTFERTDPNDPTTTIQSDVSTMPTLGFAGHYRLFGNPRGFEGGLDGSLLFSWWRDSTTITSAGGGGLTVNISTRMFIADIGFGLYGSQKLGDKVRAYAAVGPLVQFSDGKFEDELSTTSSSGFGVGLYARGGVEFEIKPGGYLGVGVRGTSSEIDFGSSVGDVNTDALQLFVTYTMGY